MASMMGYIKEIKRQFRDKYKFVPRETLDGDEPLFNNIPDGEYPMEIEGRIDHVRIINGTIECCNFENKKPK